ncbi:MULTISPECIES: hypothetical protein [unclassified Spirosoma]|uniref:hypothetical protein n=1 Tax=unclassified Spirosoma TaxID=2621999 RepID=UPI0009616659|nr:MULTISPECIES: hypothetical protein [unclassified Spirosoma]MBN8826159.1 hypothetical protein [Spirosoma sp.]OJW76942.1 MAG: hypothetical protein BGO59_22220 [Spirosoma sp. 48-14]
MKAGTFFVRTWRILSIIGFVGSLFASYISYPEEVAVRFDDLKQPIQTINRETIFYLSVAIFLIANTVLRAISKLFLRVPTAQIPVPTGVWTSHRSLLNEIFTNWFYALIAAINTILAMGLFVLSLVNRADRSLQPFDYAWLLPISTVILIAVLAGLPIRLFMKPGDDD